MPFRTVNGPGRPVNAGAKRWVSGPGRIKGAATAGDEPAVGVEDLHVGTRKPASLMNYSAFDPQLTGARGLVKIQTQVNRGQACPGTGHQCVTGRRISRRGDHAAVSTVQLRCTR